MTLKEKLEFVYQYIPGNQGDIAMLVPCHVNTLRGIISGRDIVLPAIEKRIDELYKKAVSIKAIMDE